MKIYYKKYLLTLVIMLIVPLNIKASTKFQVENDWDNTSEWETVTDGSSVVSIKNVKAETGRGIKIIYELSGDYGWVMLKKIFENPRSKELPLVFRIKCDAKGDFEIKFIDSDGSTFGRKIKLNNNFKNWTQNVINIDSLEYWWGGDITYKDLKELNIAFSGLGKGEVYIDEIGMGDTAMRATISEIGPNIDPNSELAGIGSKQRRAEFLNRENSAVLKWLKLIQDNTDDQILMSSMEDNMGQSYNNALAAMAFIVKNERKRAERILDFYARATIKDNDDPKLQNFYYKGEPRGFFQFVLLNKDSETEEYHNPGESDRWIGDMAWLLMAYKQHEKKFKSKKYRKIITELTSLIVSFYKDSGKGVGGYIQHGWRKGDKKLHEDFGDYEGNIACYAALKSVGQNEIAEKIKIWLQKSISEKNLTLSLYTLRVLAFGKIYAGLLDKAEYDLRYRKTVENNGNKVTGLFNAPFNSVNNIWIEGTAHLACAHILYGDKYRGNYYGNQLDNLLIEREINMETARALPYTLNKAGGYDWVDTGKGFTSTTAWYIFVKNRFNPLQID